VIAIDPDYEINLESELDVTPLVTNIEVVAAEIIIRTPVEVGPADLGAIPTVEDAYITFAISDVGNIDNTGNIAFGTPELILSIELDGIASTAVVSADTGVGSPTEPELILFIEDVGNILVPADPADVIQGMEDVELNQSPFSNDPDIGVGVFATLAASDINDTLDDALTKSTAFGIPTVSNV